MRRQWGEGSYDYIKTKNIWRWRGYYNNPITGKSLRKEITARDRKSLAAKVKQWQTDMQDGQSRRIKVRDWAQTWLDTIIKASTKPSTCRNYGITVRNHIIPIWGDMWLDRLTNANIQSYINALAGSHKPSTVATIRAHIRALCETAIDYGYLAKNPAAKIRLPSGSTKGRKAYLTVDECHRLLAIAKSGEYLPTTHDPASRYEVVNIT